MAISTLLPTGVVSSTGWAGVTAANLADNDLAYEATGGTVGEVIRVDIADAPADYGSGNSVVLKVQWRLSGTASKAKALLLELVGSDGVTIHATFTTPFVTSGAALHSSGALALNLAAAELSASTMRLTVQEGGGMSDSVSAQVDYMAIDLDYTAAATIPEGTATVTGAGSVTATGGIAPETKTGTAAVTGAGSSTAAGVKLGEGAATVTGSGAAAATGAKVANGVASVSGAGAAVAAGVKRAAGTATTAGTGTVTATGAAVSEIPTGSAAVTGAGSTTATGTKRAAGTATVTGAGSVAATGAKRATGAATVTGGGSVTATGGVPSVPGGAGGITGAGSVAAAGSKVAAGGTVLVAILSVSATGLNIENVVRVTETLATVVLSTGPTEGSGRMRTTTYATVRV